MSVKSKVLAGTAALAVIGGGLGVAGVTAANASTPSCGSSCISVSSEGWGTGSVLDVYKGASSAGQKITLWTASNSDGIIQKYSHDGRLMMQIGKRGVVDTSDGTLKGRAMNSSQRSSTCRPISQSIRQMVMSMYPTDTATVGSLFSTRTENF